MEISSGEAEVEIGQRLASGRKGEGREEEVESSVCYRNIDVMVLV